MQLRLGRRGFLRHSLTGALSLATLGVIGLNRASDRVVHLPHYEHIPEPSSNNFSGIVVFDSSELNEGLVWSAGRRPFDRVRMRFRAVIGGMEISLKKWSLTWGEASLTNIVDVRRKPYRIGFRLTDHSGMQLVVDGELVGSITSPAAKASLTLADNSFCCAGESGGPANRLQLFSEMSRSSNQT